MAKPIGQPCRDGKSFGNSLRNYGAVTPSTWLYSSGGSGAGPWAYVSPPMPTRSHAPVGPAVPEAVQPGDPSGSGLAGSADGGTLNINTGTAGASAAASVASDSASQPLATGSSVFTNGSATATSASDLNALVTA